MKHCRPIPSISPGVSNAHTHCDEHRHNDGNPCTQPSSVPSHHVPPRILVGTMTSLAIGPPDKRLTRLPGAGEASFSFITMRQEGDCLGQDAANLRTVA